MTANLSESATARMPQRCPLAWSLPLEDLIFAILCLSVTLSLLPRKQLGHHFPSVPAFTFLDWFFFTVLPLWRVFESCVLGVPFLALHRRRDMSVLIAETPPPESEIVPGRYCGVQ